MMTRQRTAADFIRYQLRKDGLVEKEKWAGPFENLVWISGGYLLRIRDLTEDETGSSPAWRWACHAGAAVSWAERVGSDWLNMIERRDASTCGSFGDVLADYCMCRQVHWCRDRLVQDVTARWSGAAIPFERIGTAPRAQGAQRYAIGRAGEVVVFHPCGRISIPEPIRVARLCIIEGEYQYFRSLCHSPKQV
jgi:hypothetical protein